MQQRPLALLASHRPCSSPDLPAHSQQRPAGHPHPPTQRPAHLPTHRPLRQVVHYGKSAALRCLALAYRPWGSERLDVRPEDEAGLTLVGVVGMQDPPRPEVRDAIEQCR